MAFAGVLTRRCMPPAVPAVVGAEANPNSVVGEVCGPVGTVTEIGYFDVNADPDRVDGARLPWSVARTAGVPTVVGNVVAQSDSDGIGWRIVIDGQVRAERISHEVNADTHRLVMGA